MSLSIKKLREMTFQEFASRIDYGGRVYEYVEVLKDCAKVCAPMFIAERISNHRREIDTLRQRLKDADEAIRTANEQVSEYDTIVLAAYIEKYPDPVKE